MAKCKQIQMKKVADSWPLWIEHLVSPLHLILHEEERKINISCKIITSKSNLTSNLISYKWKINVI